MKQAIDNKTIDMFEENEMNGAEIEDAVFEHLFTALELLDKVHVTDRGKMELFLAVMEDRENHINQGETK